MAGNHGGKSRGFGIEVEIHQVVEDVELRAADLDDFRRRQRLRPRARVDVSAHRECRCNLAQSVENF